MELEEWVNSVPKLPLWQDLPDIELYMDQLVSLANRYLEFIVNGQITPSMVNSYVKKNLMPKPNRKKYSQKHLVSIILITLLKQVYSLDDIRLWLNNTLKESPEENYNKFSNFFNQSITQINQKQFNLNLNNHISSKDDFILNLIIQTVISKLISEKLIKEYDQN
ncbi:DUF1836 domain-containing protein [Ligilactobacillus cholophilus]|uniref:DUF1836 domain-containing protein n=1 Tax=Ligilactobacillus cholophilus TaxID=3050131 RepID=UPI0025B0D5CB|nr:DUF1836 domain-containing protein [Ligilactobacillus cholophilus]